MNCPHCSTAIPDFADSCSHCGTPIPIGEGETIQVADSSALAPGADFGPRYRIEALLGQGGMGRVYKAYDKDLDRLVALKVVRPGAMAEGDALRRFKQELLLASKISHKNILRIHDMGEVAGVKFITMAFVEGQDLFHILKENPKMPLDRVMNFSRQLAEALAAAHAEGVIHRDLKPQNILVNKDDQIFVSDFGLAKSFQESAIAMTRTGAFMGTPRYMSPEQVEGKPADQRSDIFAFGLILYEMSTGDVPYTGESTLKVMYQRIQEKAKSPKLVNPDLPNWYVRVIMHCLERDPAARYQSMYEILADLQGGKSASGSRTVQIQLPEFTQRRWVWYVAGTVALLLILFAIPPVRHLVTGGPAEGTSKVSGVPPLGRGKYVAILPFKILGDPQTLGYVAEGLNDALSTKLFQLKDLHLASDAAVAHISDKDPLEKTARSLGANLIVQGTIQGDADRMAIIINVEDVADGKRLWSQQFNGVPKDLLSIEDQISGQLVTALNVKQTNEELARTTIRPTDNEAAYDLYLRGRQAYRGRDSMKGTQTAMDYYQQAIQQDPRFALAYTGLADASLYMYSENKDSIWADKALSAAQRAEQLNDELPEVHFSLGSVYLATGKTAQAIVEEKRGLQLAPNSDQGYIRLGNAYLDSGQKNEAIAAFEKAKEVNPYYWVVHRDLGRAYYSIGENEKALAEFQQVMQLQPENAEGWSNVATADLRLGKMQDSISAYQKSIQISPSYLAYMNLGYVYTALKQYPQAIEALEKSVELGPNQEDARGSLADAYRFSGQKEKANENYDKAIALAFHDLQVNPRDADTMGDLALYYAKRGDTKHALEYITRARDIDKADLALLYNQAIVENLSGKQSEAIATLRDALSKGYSVNDAEKDADLENLHARPDFQALIKEFEKASQK
ncbi:MAG TPA: protein kinase [Candidatus Acidoferrales bacterium]|nr:protein kinase [Candidatus Acidoferrales bacterium]